MIPMIDCEGCKSNERRSRRGRPYPNAMYIPWCTKELFTVTPLWIHLRIGLRLVWESVGGWGRRKRDEAITYQMASLTKCLAFHCCSSGGSRGTSGWLHLFYRITGFGMNNSRATVMGSNCCSQGKNFYKLHEGGISNTTGNGKKHDTSGSVSSGRDRSSCWVV